MEDQSRITVNLNMKTPYKYIMFKPTGCRRLPTDFRKHFDTEPLEMIFFGLTGTLTEETSIN
jgi:hypothetical protein